jgi:hypothetical protein
MNNKIKEQILSLKNNETIIEYVNIFKDMEKAKEVFKDNEDFKKLADDEEKVEE